MKIVQTLFLQGEEFEAEIISTVEDAENGDMVVLEFPDGTKASGINRSWFEEIDPIKDNNMESKWKLTTMKSLNRKEVNSRTGFRCHSLTPCSNPRKEKVADYETVALKFRDKNNAIRVATAILALADTDKMSDERSLLLVTAFRNRGKNEAGHSVTVALGYPLK